VSAAAPLRAEKKSPLAQLLHALNQPLTGLQCSMEVALAIPRTPEQYASGLREGLLLTERMRALVEAMREVAEIEEEKIAAGKREFALEMIDLRGVVQQIADELALVAEVKNVRLALDFSQGGSLGVKAERRQLGAMVMRLLDSALSLAARGSVMGVTARAARNTGGRDKEEPDAGEIEIRMQWQPEEARSSFSRPELGLLVTQAWLEHWGAGWERKSVDGRETLTLRLPTVLSGIAAGASAASANS
jgi:signal transduction histidine kinase